MKNMDLKMSRISVFLSARNIMFLGFFLRILVAIWNGFFGPSYGAQNDAVRLHQMAVGYANHSLSEFHFGYSYSYALGTIYSMVSDSLFLGSLLSCFAWLLSALILIKIMRLLSFNALSQCAAMLYFALLPSSILFTSVTLREVYQLLFINAVIYSLLKIFLDKSDKYWLLLLFSVMSLSALHLVLYFFGLFIISVTLITYSFRGAKKFYLVKLALIMPLVILVLFCGFRLRCIFEVENYPAATIESRVATSDIEGSTGSSIESRAVAVKSRSSGTILSNFAAAIESYQRGGLACLKDGRAFYKTSVKIDGFSGLLLFIPISLLQYLFEPMLWRISAIMDFEALFENILRAVLIWMTLAAFRSLSSQRRIAILLIFLSYLMIETIWSLGTINWGTAIRHHIPAMGLLTVTAFASPWFKNKGWVKDDQE